MLWNSNKVEVLPLTNTEQEIHVTIKVQSSKFSWVLLAIFASPKSVKRQVLWNNLSKVIEQHNMPWVLARDFDEPLIGEDKFGGRPVSVNRSLLLKDYLDKCNMIDRGFTGPHFTWINRRGVQDLIQERIDKIFVKPSWCLLYPKSRCHI